MIEGDWVELGYHGKLPIIPGHEISGVVEEVGKNVKMWKVGQRVGVQVLYESCRHCEYCLTGREHLCPDARYTGETVDGAFAEIIVAPWDFVYSIPDNLGFEESAPLFCPGVTAYRAVRRAGVGLGQKVAVIGVGGVGQMSVQFAGLAGGEITAVNVSNEKLNLASELGADHSVLLTELDSLGKFDVVMVHTPSQQAIDHAARSVKPGGTLLLAVRANLSVDSTHEYTLETSMIGPRIDMLNVLKLASKGKIKAKWQDFELSEANDVLLKLKRGEVVGRALLVP